jgi:hypothetical protein
LMKMMMVVAAAARGRSSKVQLLIDFSSQADSRSLSLQTIYFLLSLTLGSQDCQRGPSLASASPARCSNSRQR